MIKYLSVEARQKTFKGFAPVKGAPLCNPECFARAGFYNISSKKDPDLVKCFACHKELGNWEPGDDPWQEHVRRGETCPFVVLHNKEEVTVDDVITFFLAEATANIQSKVQEVKEAVMENFKKELKFVKE